MLESIGVAAKSASAAVAAPAGGRCTRRPSSAGAFGAMLRYRLLAEGGPDADTALSRPISISEGVHEQHGRGCDEKPIACVK